MEDLRTDPCEPPVIVDPVEQLADEMLEQQKHLVKFIADLYGDIEDQFKLISWTKHYKTTVAFNVVEKDDLASHAITLSKDDDVYFAPGLQQSAPPSGKRGDSTTVVAIPGLWMDIDIQGTGHASHDYPENFDQALEFVQDIPFGPPSLVVKSGGGLHAYWLFKEPWVFESEKERAEAANLLTRFQGYIHQLGMEHGWKLDNTSDLSRLLRLPGTLNHKYDPPTPVKVIYNDGPRYNPEDIENELPTNIPTPPIPKALYAGYDDQPSADLELILECCAFMRHFRDNATGLKEPEWTAGLSIVARCADARQRAHDLSLPYQGYSSKETDAKLAHVTRNMGPRTCDWIVNENGFEKCRDCDYRGKITSPIQLGLAHVARHDSEDGPDPGPTAAWVRAQERFPRSDLDWDILPPEVSESFQQLARSCDTSPNAVPGIAFGVIASIFGKRVSVAAKRSWVEPLIIWYADVRDTGEGKTPLQKNIIGPLDAIQKRESQNFRSAQQRFEENARKPQNDQEDLPEPIRKLFLVRNLTLEGLHNQLQRHPTGGLLCHLGELSAFIRSQDQYKSKKGTDRESWLSLWDGEDVAIVRANKSFEIYDPRVSVVGGIQRRVFKEVFGGQNGFYLEDGTVHRFLYNYEEPESLPPNLEEWSEENEELWRSLVQKANHLVGQGLDITLDLTDAAKQELLEWRKGIRIIGRQLPSEVYKFLPKAERYCLRLAGVIHCIWKLSEDIAPGPNIEVEDLQRGIAAVEFYLSNAVQAMMNLRGKQQPTGEPKGRTPVEPLFAKALLEAKGKLDNGLITCGELTDIFNQVSPARMLDITAKQIGVWIDEYGLTKTPERQRANGIQGFCLIWDEKADQFIQDHLGEK